MTVACPGCGEVDDLTGTAGPEGITVTCGACGRSWERDAERRCPTCGTSDLRTVPLAILEKSRGTQLSMLGTRPIDLCPTCDADDLARWQRHRPNPLMPKDLPTT